MLAKGKPMAKHGPKPKPPIERFHALYKEDPVTGCWVNPKSKTDYGGFLLGPGHIEMSHRAAWILFRGPIPGGLFVCHSCDNTKCANPKHLFLGTQLQNMADMVKKGRHPRAGRKPRQPNSIITAVRRLRARGMVYTELISIFDLEEDCLRDIVMKRGAYSY